MLSLTSSVTQAFLTIPEVKGDMVVIDWICLGFGKLTLLRLENEGAEKILSLFSGSKVSYLMIETFLLVSSRSRFILSSFLSV